jgi:hypothetical protein
MLWLLSHNFVLSGIEVRAVAAVVKPDAMGVSLSL